MKKTVSILLAALGMTGSVHALVFIDTVPVGDVGNPADPLTGYGQVNYDYYIGTYEVTNSQYTTFLNAAAATDPHSLYNTYMETSNGGITRGGSSGSYTYSTIPGSENNPVIYFSFWDAARFANWLTTGDTESGVYNLTPAGISNNTITRNATAWNAGGVAIASENEWYKAAYYSGSPTGADGDGYWLYPTQSNSVTNADANYNTRVRTKPVGSYDAPSHYGTFDQGGNVWELNDDISGTGSRVLRGGSYFSFNDAPLQSLIRYDQNPAFKSATIGFRVTSLQPIPEPTTYALLAGLLSLGVILLRRKNHR